MWAYTKWNTNDCWLRQPDNTDPCHDNNVCADFHAGSTTVPDFVTYLFFHGRAMSACVQEVAQMATHGALALWQRV